MNLRSYSCGSRDGVPVFLNDLRAVAEDIPQEVTRAAGGTATMFFVVSDVDALHTHVAAPAKVLMPLKTQFYGMREFAVEDPDEHILTFAQRVEEVK